jgi:cytochrome P450
LQKLTIAHINSTSSTLVIGGSETSATVLSAAVFYLTKNRDVLDKLAREILSTFESEADIDMTSVQKLTYTTAVLNEAMRLYPPVVSASPRKIAKGGAVVMGRHVPERVGGASFKDHRGTR